MEPKEEDMPMVQGLLLSFRNFIYCKILNQ